MIALIRLTRPHFLLGGALLFALGTVAAGGAPMTTYLVGQSMVSAIQLTAHLVNEYADAEADAAVRNRTWFSGGSGVIADGAVERATALRAALVTSTLAVATITAVALREPVAGAIGAGAFAVAWAYSIEPVRLLDTGFGELLTTLVVAAGVPLTGAIVAGGPIEVALWWAIAVLTPIHLAMMLTFELPDLDSDRTTGKRVLAVRFGASATRLAVPALVASGMAVLGLGLGVGALRRPAAWAAVAFLPALLTAGAIARAGWRQATAGAVATLVAAALGLMAGL